MSLNVSSGTEGFIISSGDKPNSNNGEGVSMCGTQNASEGASNVHGTGGMM